MAWKIYDFECPDCGPFEALVDGHVQNTVHECGIISMKMMSAPAIHTLETHMRGYREELPDEKWTPAHGFRDVNLTDKNGNPTVYHSLAEKNRLLKENGLSIKESSKDWTKQRRNKRPMRFTGQSNRGSQLGINKGR